MQTLPKDTTPNESSKGTVKGTVKEDYTNLYWESTQETLVGLYGKRDPLTGQPVEAVNDIIHRVAQAVSLAELKYVMSPEQLLDLTLDEAVEHPKVMQWKQDFAENIGNQRFWANTPANINADPEVSRKVLQYWAHGTLAKIKEEDIWLRSEELRLAYLNKHTEKLSEHEA